MQDHRGGLEEPKIIDSFFRHENALGIDTLKARTCRFMILKRCRCVSVFLKQELFEKNGI